MLTKSYRKIMEGSEEHRNRWAFGLAATLSVLIFVGFAFYKGYVSFGDESFSPRRQVAASVSADSAPSPIQNTREGFAGALQEIQKKYTEFKDSLSSVLVPFLTGIEVYERE